MTSPQLELRIDRLSGASPADVQLAHEGLEFHAGAAYLLVFQAQADAPRSIRCRIRNASEPARDLGFDQEVLLAAAWKTYSLEFVCTRAESAAGLSLYLGGNSAAVRLRQVALYDQSETDVNLLAFGPAIHNRAPDLLDRKNFASPVNRVDSAPAPLGKVLSSIASTDAGRLPWQLFDHDLSGARLIEVSPKRQHLRVEFGTSPATEPWRVQLQSTPVDVFADRDARLRFRARSDQPRSIQAGIGQNHSPWSNLGWYRRYDLVRSWQTFDVVIRPNQHEAGARVHFDLGESSVPLELSDVSWFMSAPAMVDSPSPLSKDSVHSVTAAASAAERPSSRKTTPDSPPKPIAGELKLVVEGQANAEFVSSETDPRARRLRVLAPDPRENRHIRLELGPIAIQQGKPYIFSFAAIADAARSIEVEVVSNKSATGARRCFRKSLQLNIDGWSAYDVLFETAETIPDARVWINAGRELPAFSILGAALQEASAVPADRLASALAQAAGSSGMATDVVASPWAGKRELDQNWLLAIPLSKPVDFAATAASRTIHLASDLSSGSQPDHVRIGRLIGEIAPRETVSLSFQARSASSARLLVSVVGVAGQVLNRGLEDEFQLTSQWVQFARTFTAQGSAEMSVFVLEAVGSPPNVELDDLQLSIGPSNLLEFTPDRRP